MRRGEEGREEKGRGQELNSSDSKEQGRLLLHESFDGRGALRKTWLERRAGELFLRAEPHSGSADVLTLPGGSLQAVMRRYAKPLDGDLVRAASRSDPLELVDGSRLWRLRFRPTYDVIAKDYLVWEKPGETALVELATTVCAALQHLGKAAVSAGVGSPQD